MDSSSVDSNCWKDITEEFKSLVGQLNLGELMKIDNFTLLEAMSAIELLDPKMDSGVILRKANRQILNLEQSVRLGLVKINNLELDELIGIMDETYACLVTWLEGEPLAQTVMTNLYLHDPERIEDRALRIFTQAIKKLVNSIETMVQMIFCIEEEDFFCEQNRFNLANNQISDQKILSSLEDLCQYYERLLIEQTTNLEPNSNNKKHIKSKTDTNSSQIDETKREEENSTCEEKSSQHLLKAMIDRLRFTYNIYACFSTISKNLLKEHNVTGANSALLIQKTIKLVQSSTQTCDQHLVKCLKHLDSWLDTIELGIKPNKATGDGQYDVYHPTIMGFEPMINHKILPAAYPRFPKIKSRPLMIDYFKQLIVRLRDCISISNSFHQKSFSKSLDLIEQFSRYSRPKSCVISRSFLQVLYLPTRINSLLKEELLQSMNDYCEPIIQSMKKDSTRSMTLEEFLDESSRTFSQAIILYGHNSARQYEKFHDLIVSFKNLQYSSYLVNDIFKNCVIYSWTTYYFAKFCIKYVLAGLELELFSSHEYPYVFWYLYDILYRNEREQLEQAKQLVLDSQIIPPDDKTTSKGGPTAAKKNNKAKKQRRKNQYNTNFHDRNLLRNEAFRLLTGGLFLLTYGLKLQGKIKSPSMEFTSEEICFFHRFGTISGASVYQAYKITLSRLGKLEYIYREALECFSEARVLFERHGELENCLTVCKTNMIVAKILSSNMNSFANSEVEFSFDRHPSLPTVKL